MSTTKNQTNFISENTIKISEVTRYLSFAQAAKSQTGLTNELWCHEVKRGCVSANDLDISDEAKQLGAAIQGSLNDIKDFGYRNTQKMTFGGSIHLTEERQELDANFFFANKENVLAIMNEIMQTQSARPNELNYFLASLVCSSPITDNTVAEAFQEIKQADSMPQGRMVDMHSYTSLYGVIISQMLYQMLYHIEAHHAKHFHHR